MHSENVCLTENSNFICIVVTKFLGCLGELSMCRYEHGSMPLAVYFISKGIAAHVAVPTKVRTALAWLIVRMEYSRKYVIFFHHQLSTSVATKSCHSSLL